MPKKKTTSVKKKAAKKTAKKAVKQAAKKAAKKPTKVATKKTAKKVIQKAAKKAPTKKVLKKAPAKKATPKPTKAPETIKVASVAPKNSESNSKNTPIVFSLDDVEELMASKKTKTTDIKRTVKKAVKKTAKSLGKKVTIEDKPVKQRVLGAASLADILGFNPTEKKKGTDLNSKEVPQKWQKYYKLLIELRRHVSDEIDLHTSDTLKHSAREDSGDLSNQSGSGTDTFDRDFALSLVSGEQEALNEIEEAIQRIKNGTYGICGVTGKAIPAARLTAVPFAHYSVEGQAEYEKNLRRKVDRTGNASLFGDSSDAPKIASSDDDE